MSLQTGCLFCGDFIVSVLLPFPVFSVAILLSQRAFLYNCPFSALCKLSLDQWFPNWFKKNIVPNIRHIYFFLQKKDKAKTLIYYWKTGWLCLISVSICRVWKGIYAPFRLRCDGQQLCELWRSAQQPCHRQTRCTSGTDRLVRHSEMATSETLIQQVFIEQLFCQHCFEEMNSTHCGAGCFILNHHTHLNCALFKALKCFFSGYLLCCFDRKYVSLDLFHPVET